MSLEDRQRKAMMDFNRSSFTPPAPPAFSPAHKRLDAIAAADERDRQQRKQVELMEADLIAYAKQGELKPIE